MSIKAQLVAGAVCQGDKPTVQASMAMEGDYLVIRIPRDVTLASLRESEKSLFAACQAAPTAECGLTVTDEETRKRFFVPVDRKINLNLFVSWLKHRILQPIKAQAEQETVEQVPLAETISA